MENNKNEEAFDKQYTAFGLWRLLDHTRYMIFRFREKELESYGVTPIQAYVLDITINNGGTVSINDIVSLTQRRHHTISTLIARMERHGLLVRTRDPKDARRWYVSITEKGREQFARISRDSITQIFSVLNTEDLAGLEKVLNKLIVAAYEASGEPVPAEFSGVKKIISSK